MMFQWPDVGTGLFNMATSITKVCLIQSLASRCRLKLLGRLNFYAFYTIGFSDFAKSGEYTSPSFSNTVPKWFQNGLFAIQRSYHTAKLFIMTQTTGIFSSAAVASKAGFWPNPPSPTRDTTTLLG